jgi:hypothetical protein
MSNYGAERTTEKSQLLTRFSVDTLESLFAVLSSFLAVTSPGGDGMATWILQCPNWKTDFEHSQINDVGMASYYLPLKPDLPPKGVECTCPRCGSKATYQRKNLCYRA